MLTQHDQDVLKNLSLTVDAFKCTKIERESLEQNLAYVRNRLEASNISNIPTPLDSEVAPESTNE